MGWLLDVFNRINGTQPIKTYRQLFDALLKEAPAYAQRSVLNHVRGIVRGSYYKLMTEPEFVESYRTTRWSALPLSLGDIHAVLQHLILPHCQPDQKDQINKALVQLIEETWQHFTPSQELSQQQWQEAHKELMERVKHPSEKFSLNSLANNTAEKVFPLIPLSVELYKSALDAFKSNMNFSLNQVHEMFYQKLDYQSLIPDLLEHAGKN